VLLSLLLGCAAKENLYWAVTDSEEYWNRNGFAVQPPSGTKWYKLPVEDKLPNLITFAHQEGMVYGSGQYWYLTATTAFAYSVLLDEPVQEQSDKKSLEEQLREHLLRYQLFRGETVSEVVYNPLQGLDCVSYKATPTKKSHRTDRGEVFIGRIKGYLCLHPEQHSFGVVMELRDLATAGSELVLRDGQTEHFIKSLRFTPFSSSVSQTYPRVSYQLGAAPTQMVPYREKLWVALRDENRVVQVEPLDGKVVASVGVGSHPVALVHAAGSLWVANSGDGTVMRIDPSTGRVTHTISVGGEPVALCAGLGQVWVADRSGSAVIRVNATSGAVAARIAVGSQPVSIGFSKEGVWTANAGDGTLSLIDRSHDWVNATLKVGGRPVSVASANGVVWVADADGGQVLRIDGTSKEVTARIKVGGSPGWVTAYDGWDVLVALPSASRIVRVDPKKNRVFGSAIPGEGAPCSMVVLGAHLWFANGAGSSVARVVIDSAGAPVLSRPPETAAAAERKN